MRSIALYIEGGGPNSDGQAALRQGFDVLLSRQKDSARVRRIRWKTVLCGARNATFEAFINATTQQTADLVALIVDAEAPVAASTDDGRVAHLEKHDSWTFKKISPSHVHLMTQCMEAWLVADPDGLEAFYGKGFRRNALPQRPVLDDEPKLDLYSALKNATKGTQKQSYEKIQHASELLKRVRTDVVARRCTSFRHLTEWLDLAIATG